MKHLGKILMVGLAIYGVVKVVDNIPTKEEIKESVERATQKTIRKVVKAAAEEIFERNPQINGTYDPNTKLYSFNVTFGGNHETNMDSKDN